MSKQSSYSRKLVPDSPERKLSVFDRLGTKPPLSAKSKCESWAQNGTCPLKKACNPSKRCKSEAMKKQSVLSKKSKDEHKKSTKAHQSSEVDWEQWELENLEGADEKALERRRQELQRELQLQLRKEKELTKKKDKPDKKRTRSSSSSSTSSSVTSSSTSSSSSSSSAPRKHQSRKRKHHATSTDSDVSPQRQKKSPKLLKAKTVVGPKKDKKEGKIEQVLKKTAAHKKSPSSSWDRQRARSPVKQTLKKPSPHHSSDGKHGSSSPRYYSKERTASKTKPASPKRKSKEVSPKRLVKRKDESSYTKDRLPKPTASKGRLSPARTHNKASPLRCRKQEESFEKKRAHDDRKHSPRRDRSREKDRKRDGRRRTPESESGGLKKGGKILPLKATSYTRESGSKSKEPSSKTEKPSDVKSKDEDMDRDKARLDRPKDRDKDKGRNDRDKDKERKEEEQDRKREREGRDRRDTERMRLAKEREAERQRERDEALERCRERQREREKLQKEKKDKDDKKHHRDHGDSKKEFEKELPALLDLKTDHKPVDKHASRERRNDKLVSDKTGDLPKLLTPDRDDRRDSRRSADRRQAEPRRGRDPHPSDQVVRRTLTEGRRPWEDRRRGLDDRRPPLALLGRGADDLDYRRAREEAEDLRLEDRRRKLGHGFHHDGPRDGAWEGKEGDLDYREAERREGWDRHHDWPPASRYDRKWVDHDRDRDDPAWNSYGRRSGGEEWNNDCGADETARHRPYPISDENRADHTEKNIEPKKHLEGDGTPSLPSAAPGGVQSQPAWEGDTAPEEVREPAVTNNTTDGLGEALSDISDDADDILNQDDDIEENNTVGGNSNPTVTSAPSQPVPEFLFDQRKPLLECLGERALDFEEISDEELEEEARLTRGIMDVLGADWAGLVQQTRPRTKRPEGPGSTHRRWRLDKIVERIGISYKLAGNEFADALVAKCKDIALSEDKMEQEKSAEEGKLEVKLEPLDETMMTEVKSEPMEVKQEAMEMNEEVAEAKPQPMCLLAREPSVHVALKESRLHRTSLFANHNRFKRALSARTDLAIRRELSNLPAKEPLIFPPPLDTTALYQISVGLFQRSLKC